MIVNSCNLLCFLNQFADEVLEQIEDGYLMDPPDGCPDGVYDLMTECWSLERKARPTFVAVREMLARSFGKPVLFVC